MAIITDLVTNPNLSAWGVSGAEYVFNGEKVNFQDLMVAVTTQRAATVEKEVEPMATRMCASRHSSICARRLRAPSR